MPYSASLYTVFHSVNYNSVGFAFCPNTVEDRIRIRNTAMLVLLSGSGLKGPAPNRFCIRNTLHVRNGLTDRYPNSLQWKISIWLSTLTASFEINNLVWETEGGVSSFILGLKTPNQGPSKWRVITMVFSLRVNLSWVVDWMVCVKKSAGSESYKNTKENNSLTFFTVELLYS